MCLTLFLTDIHEQLLLLRDGIHAPFQYLLPEVKINVLIVLE